MDYTQLEPLKAYTNDPTHGFDTTKALEYKEKAVEELTAAGATFPVKILMSYNPSTANWDKQCQIVEQQLEETLGKDYIDIYSGRLVRHQLPLTGPSGGRLRSDAVQLGP